MSRKKLTTEEALAEILQGVDIIGTMLDRELPRLRSELAGLLVEAPVRPGAADTISGSRMADLATTLGEIRELLEEQDRRLSALDLRLTRLAEAVAARRDEGKR